MSPAVLGQGAQFPAGIEVEDFGAERLPDFGQGFGKERFGARFDGLDVEGSLLQEGEMGEKPQRGRQGLHEVGPEPADPVEIELGVFPPLQAFDGKEQAPVLSARPDSDVHRTPKLADAPHRRPEPAVEALFAEIEMMVEAEVLDRRREADGSAGLDRETADSLRPQGGEIRPNIPFGQDRNSRQIFERTDFREIPVMDRILPGVGDELLEPLQLKPADLIGRKPLALVQKAGTPDPEIGRIGPSPYVRPGALQSPVSAMGEPGINLFLSQGTSIPFPAAGKPES